MSVSDIEFSLPRPSYTIDTLTYMKEKHPNHCFCLIMGEDNLKNIKKWKNYPQLIAQYEIIVYPRKLENPPHTEEYPQHDHIQLINAPIIELSSSLIRRMIHQKKNVRPMLPPEVYTLIDKYGYYE